jgi:hypothetical protein
MGYRGVWASEDAYIRGQIREHLPEFLTWLLGCCDPARLRAGYTAGLVKLWSTPASGGQVHVFESTRSPGRDRRRRPRGIRRARARVFA